MGRCTYYSPLAIGALLVLALNEPLRAALPPMTAAQTWLVVAGIAVIAALQCQVLMMGAQGAFAQVWPVPWGRSIRGRAAAAGGWLLMGWVGLSAVSALLATESLFIGAQLVGSASVVALAAAVLIYIWNIPAAVPDFGSDFPRRGPTEPRP